MWGMVVMVGGDQDSVRPFLRGGCPRKVKYALSGRVPFLRGGALDIHYESGATFLEAHPQSGRLWD